MAQHVGAGVCEEGSELTPLILNPNDEFSSCSSVAQWEKAHTRADPERGHSEQLPIPPPPRFFCKKTNNNKTIYFGFITSFRSLP